MNENKHPYVGCARAYIALAEASACVTAYLSNELESRFSLDVNEFETLLTLGEQPDKTLPLSDLRERIRLSQPALGRLHRRLERRHLINCHTAENDRRKVMVQITPDGQELLDRAIPVQARCVHDAILDRLTIAERDALRSILLKISN